MTQWHDQVREAIDERIKAAAEQTATMGTVTSRDTTGVRAMVVFDGDILSVPVKVLGTVDVDAGDRVTLQLFGSDWIVTGGFTQRGPARATVNGGVSSLSTTSATNVDFPGVVTTITKRYDGTVLKIEMTISVFTTGGTAVVVAGVRINGVDYDVVGVSVNTTSAYHTAAATAFVSGIPAGTYTVQGRIRRVSGSGTVSSNADGWESLAVTEQW